MQTFRYGPAGSQLGDLHLPKAKSPPVICLLHGGFWRLPYARDQYTPIAEDLVRRGYAAWNLEYRRLG
ncbi:MAG TPA: alpha/beta hydrolase, partial [Gammaproteobacteria bacterium]|nr:alpha/beta hydrolase [Gammaproteobacteria bacterium]